MPRGKKLKHQKIARLIARLKEGAETKFETKKEYIDKEIVPFGYHKL